MQRKVLIGCGVAAAALTILAGVGFLGLSMYVRSAMRNVGVATRPSEQQQAISRLTAQIGRQPADPQLYARRAAAYGFARDYDRALEDWDRAGQLEPANPLYPYMKGMTCEMAQRNSEAAVAYRQALRVVSASSGDPRAREWTARVRERLARVEAPAPAAAHGP